MMTGGYYVYPSIYGTLYISSGGVINFNDGDVTITHSSNALTLAGGVLLLPDGTEANPALAFASSPTTGVWTPGAGYYRIGTNSYAYTFGGGELNVSNSNLTFSGTKGGAADVILGRDAAATLQMGADAASPTAQTFKGPDGSGADKAGGGLTIAPGNGTGTGVSGTLYLKAAPVGASSSTQNTAVEQAAVTASGLRYYTPVTTYSGNQTLTTAECENGFVTVTGAATIVLPAVGASKTGLCVTIYVTAAVAVSIDPNAADRIVLNGTALDDGDKITNASEAGSFVTLVNDSTSGWRTVGISGAWVDGGA